MLGGGGRGAKGEDVSLARGNEDVHTLPGGMHEGMLVAYFPDPVKSSLEDGYPSPAVRMMLRNADISHRQITLEELLGGCLLEEGFTALCVPGGFAPNYLSRLGALGATIIREFIAAGGGYIGLCAIRSIFNLIFFASL